MDATEIQAVATSVGRRLATELVDVQQRQDWAAVTTLMDHALAELAATECWGEENQLPSSVFWREAGDVLKVGSLQAHARFKPHGYAGDFEMLERLVHRDVRGEGLALAFDQYFQDHPAPYAVRNRTTWIADAIVAGVQSSDGDYHIVSLGSGPAADVREAVERLSAGERGKLHVTLLDLDEKGLDFARKHLAGELGEQRLNARRDNLFRLPRRGADDSLRCDFIYCTGLFDYLNDDDAVDMLRWMDSIRKDQGRLVMMNFAPANASRAYMEWAGMWYLIHRTADDIAELAERAGFAADTWRITAEPLGIDLILDRNPSNDG